MNSLRNLIKFKSSIAAVSAIALFTVLLTGCLKTDPVPQPVLTYVAIYQGSPNGPTTGLYIKADNNQINSASFDYTEYTGYLNFVPGNRTLAFGPFNSSNITLDSTLTFKQNKLYSVFVADEFPKPTLVVLGDSAAAPVSGKAYARVINLSPDAGNIDFKISGVALALATDLQPKNATAFKQVDAGELDFQVLDSNNELLLIENATAMLQSGRYYTIVVRGYKTPPSGNTNKLAVQLLSNN